MAVDANGDVFVADTNNTAVKEIPYSEGAYGAPLTPGSGFSYPTGVAVDAYGNVFVADSYNNPVKEIPFSGGAYGAVLTLRLDYCQEPPVAAVVTWPQSGRWKVAFGAGGPIRKADSGVCLVWLYRSSLARRSATKSLHNHGVAPRLVAYGGGCIILSTSPYIQRAPSGMPLTYSQNLYSCVVAVCWATTRQASIVALGTSFERLHTRLLLSTGPGK